MKVFGLPLAFAATAVDHSHQHNRQASQSALAQSARPYLDTLEPITKPAITKTNDHSHVFHPLTALRSEDTPTDPSQRTAPHQEAKTLRHGYGQNYLSRPTTTPEVLLDGKLIKDAAFTHCVVNDPLLFCPLPAEQATSSAMNHDQKANLLQTFCENLSNIAQSAGIEADIEWRIKSSQSALGKLLMEALAIERNDPLSIKNKQEALNLIARHHALINHLAHRKNSDGKPLHPNFLSDHLGVRVVINGPQATNDCFKLFHCLKQSIEGTQTTHLSINPEHCKDYISQPKANGYQSLHIGVLSHHGKNKAPQPIELQIRTRAMDENAQTGSAAHDTYKRTQQLLIEAFFIHFKDSVTF